MQFYRSGRIVVSSALVTEAWALRIASGMAVDMGISKAIFESDCRAVIDCINNKGEQNLWEISALVADMKEWATNKDWTFTWAGRERNTAAHWIASSSLENRLTGPPGCIPPGLASLLLKDCLS